MLPKYHEEIRAGIPDSLIHRSFWASDALERNNENESSVAQAQM